MSATTIHRKEVTVTAPSSKGTFQGRIDFNPPDGDLDNERLDGWVNLPASVPLGFMHLYSDQASVVGMAECEVEQDGRHMKVFGRLDLSTSMGRAIHERLLAPPSSPESLSQLSVGFASSYRYKDANGVTVLGGNTLLEVSIVAKGAQDTQIFGAKSGQRNSAADQQRIQAAHDALVDAGAVCIGATNGYPVDYTPKSASARCSCGSKSFMPSRSIRAIRDGRDYGLLSWRSCRRCGEKLLSGSRVLQKRDNGDGWSRWINSQVRSPMPSVTQTATDDIERLGELEHYKQLLDQLEIGARRRAPVRDNVGWISKSLDRMAMLPRG